MTLQQKLEQYNSSQNCPVYAWNETTCLYILIISVQRISSR